MNRVKADTLWKKGAAGPAVIGAACWPKSLIFVPDKEGRTALRGHSLFFPGTSNTFLRLPRNLRLLLLLYWMTPLITPGTAWLARSGANGSLKKQIITIRCASPGKRKKNKL